MWKSLSYKTLNINGRHLCKIIYILSVGDLRRLMGLCNGYCFMQILDMVV